MMNINVKFFFHLFIFWIIFMHEKKKLLDVHHALNLIQLNEIIAFMPFFTLIIQTYYS
jgi:hypothetical protein